MDNLQGIFFIPPFESNAVAHILKEIYIDGLYEPYLPKNRSGSVVIDCGGNIGLTSYYFSKRFEKVYTIEPVQAHLDVMNYMLKFNKIDNVYPYKFALSMHDKKEENIYHYSNRTMHSLYGGIDKMAGVTGGLKQIGSEKIELKRLDTFMREQGIEHVNLLKSDIEGVEFEVFGSEGFKQVASKIDCIVGEVHGYSSRNPNQLRQSFEDNGFTFQWLPGVPGEAQLFAATKNE